MTLADSNGIFTSSETNPTRIFVWEKQSVVKSNKKRVLNIKIEIVIKMNLKFYIPTCVFSPFS